MLIYIFYKEDQVENLKVLMVAFIFIEKINKLLKSAND